MNQLQARKRADALYKLKLFEGPLVDLYCVSIFSFALVNVRLDSSVHFAPASEVRNAAFATRPSRLWLFVHRANRA